MTARIYPVMPFALDRNFGRACNEAMSLLPDGAWGVIVDHDIAWTTGAHWFGQIAEAVATIPKAGAFAVMTNRIACKFQRDREGWEYSSRIDAMRKVGKEVVEDAAFHEARGEYRRLHNRTLLDITDTNGFGGVVTVLSRDAWKEAGGYADGLFCVDHSIFFRLRDAGRRSYVMENLYVYHKRGTSSKPGPQEPKWKECPCRGPEVAPRERIALP